jgi:hypothetical protein
MKDILDAHAVQPSGLSAHCPLMRPEISVPYLEFMGTEGRLHISRAGYEYVPKEKAGEVVRQKQGGKDELHVANWLDCIRTRKEPNATVVHGHYGSMACHIANLADRQKVRVHWKKDWEV